MSACKLVLFDCDGTLIDSEMITCTVEAELLGEAGFEISVKEFVRRFAGTSKQHINDTMHAQTGRHLPDDYEQRVASRLLERLWREAKPIEGVHEMLDRLDCPRCVCSNAGMEKLKVEMQRTELWDRFRPYIYSAQDIEGIAQKPEPDVYLHAAKEFGAAADECIVVEDSITGVQSGVAAGMRVIGITAGCHIEPGHAEKLTDAGALTVTNRITEIPALVEALSQWDSTLV